MRHYGEHGEAREGTVSVFIETFAPPPRMLIFGAVDFTKALVKVAKVLGYHVTVCDAREVFATRRRFPDADEVVVDWPHRLLEREGATLGPRDAVCVLTHDHKFDVPAIVAALQTDVGYLGAMGSRRTHAERVERLRDRGSRRCRHRPHHGPHRARPRRPHARGDRHLHLRRDHRPADGPRRPVAARQRRRHPPLRATARNAQTSPGTAQTSPGTAQTSMVGSGPTVKAACQSGSVSPSMDRRQAKR